MALKVAAQRRRAHGVLAVAAAALAAALWSAGAPAAPPAGAASAFAFAGAGGSGAALPAPAPGQPKLRLVALEAGRDWRPGNVAKKGVDYRAQGGAAFGGPTLKKKDTKKKGKAAEDTSNPEIYKDVPVIYNGKKVGSVNGTIAEYKVDIWSGAHPVWRGEKGKVLLNSGSVTRFQEKFGAAAEIFGDTGMAQLKENAQIKKEQEARKAAGLKVY